MIFIRKINSLVPFTKKNKNTRQRMPRSSAPNPKWIAAIRKAAKELQGTGSAAPAIAKLAKKYYKK